jgi:hypothetical protein
MASVPGEYKHSTAMVEFAAAQIGARWWFWLPCRHTRSYAKTDDSVDPRDALRLNAAASAVIT